MGVFSVLKDFSFHIPFLAGVFESFMVFPSSFPFMIQAALILLKCR